MGACCSNSAFAKTPENDAIEKDLRELGEILSNEIRVLLLGTGESGKSTVFKQMKILQDKGGFLPEEIMAYRNIIRGNCISQMRTLCAAVAKMQNFFDSDHNAQLAQSIGTLESYNDWSPQVAELISTLWRDSGVRKTYDQQGVAFQLDDSAAYLFDNVPRIAGDDYQPTYQDILRARTRTTGVDEAIFVYKNMEFRMIDVGGQRSERRKWIAAFDCVTAVLFCVSLADYDLVLREDRTQNRLKESLLLFAEIFNNPIFQKIDFVVFFNKTDLFPEKIAKSSLKTCFPEYAGSSNPEEAREYIKNRFLEVRDTSKPHKTHCHFTCAIDPENMKLIFASVRQTLLSLALRDTFGDP